MALFVDGSAATIDDLTNQDLSLIHIYILLTPDRVHLPEIDIIRLQHTERGFQIPLRFLRGSLFGFGRQKYILSNAIEADAVCLFGVPVPIGARTVEVGHAKVVYLSLIHI